MYALIREYMDNYEFYVILSGSAIQYTESFKKDLYNVRWYYPSNTYDDGFVEHSESILYFCTIKVTDVQYELLYETLKSFVVKINPSIIIRGTPCFELGIEELLPRVSKDIGVGCYCYQECYGVGNCLNDNEDKIACVGVNNVGVIDFYAKTILLKAGFAKNIVIVGDITYWRYKHLESFSARRKRLRNTLAVGGDFVILYCMLAVNDPENEVRHFRSVANSIEVLQKRNANVKFFVKFHPRNNDNEKALVRNSNTDFFEFEYSSEDACCFADVIISACSSINGDALAYYSAFENDQCVLKSIYTKGKWEYNLVMQYMHCEEWQKYRIKDGHIFCDIGDELTFMLESILSSDIPQPKTVLFAPKKPLCLENLFNGDFS
jgi:hypothetical protein